MMTGDEQGITGRADAWMAGMTDTGGGSGSRGEEEDGEEEGESRVERLRFVSQRTNEVGGWDVAQQPPLLLLLPASTTATTTLARCFFGVR